MPRTALHTTAEDPTPDLMPIDALVPSGINPRREHDATADAELLASVQTHGIVTPLLVRPSARPGTWEIVAGHRRHAAALEAGLTEVPVLIRELNDQEAREIALVENLQRRNLSPLDEATGFKTLLDFAGTKHTPKSVAAAIGMPERYVWDRLKLLDLVPTAQQLLAEGRITIQHAIKIAKLTPEQQDRVIDPDDGGLFEGEDGLFAWTEDELEELERSDPYHDMKPVTTRELDAWIAKHVRFDAVQAAASDPLDFGPVAERVTEAIAKPGRGKKVVHITREYHVHPDAKDTKRTFCHDAWKRADGHEGSEPCDDAVLGVVVVGPGYGDAFDVCVNKDCDVHWKAERKAREKQAARNTSQGSASSSRGSGSDYWEVQKREREIWEAVEPQVIAAIVAGTAKLQTTDAHLAAAIESVRVYDHRARALKAAVPTITMKTFGRAWTLGKALSNLYDAAGAKKTLKDLGITFDLAGAIKAEDANRKTAADAKKPAPKAKTAAKKKAARR